MGYASPKNRNMVLIFSIALISMTIISSQSPIAFSGMCKDDDGDLFCDPPDCDDNDATVYPGHGCPEPVEIIEEVIVEVQDLSEDGTITSGQANALLVKLENAVDKIESNQINGAINSLNAFINQIKSLMNSGKISPAVGDSMISDVYSIIETLQMG